TCNPESFKFAPVPRAHRHQVPVVANSPEITCPPLYDLILTDDLGDRKVAGMRCVQTGQNDGARDPRIVIPSSYPTRNIYGYQITPLFSGRVVPLFHNEPVKGHCEAPIRTCPVEVSKGKSGRTIG
ncbi:hypothetical protein PRIPAC_86995, partial [Pristionchus pacificus]|uniref:Uncharacterized protein n=1 Tax=Pristionchus pacificus TaxID=54126 RepID=A0A2A6BUC5_PRIPA